MTSDALLFVYGTLRRGAGHPRNALLEKHATLIGDGHLQARLYEVDGYPAAIPSDTADEHVKGELYRLDDPGILATLDDYEECSASFPAPREYRREHVAITLENGDNRTAWAYLYNRSVDGLQHIDCGDYLAWAGRKP